MTSLQKRTAETPGAQRVKNEPRWMHGDAYMCVTRYGSRRCERCVSLR